MSNYFAFIDESGNSTQERFFGLGLLIIDDEIGDFYDKMKSYYDKAKDIAYKNKLLRIQTLKETSELEQLAKIAGSSKNFELKFKYINSTNNDVYKSLIDQYFVYQKVKFCALVVDRGKHKSELNPWDAYIHEASMLIANNIRNISPCQICVLADDLTRPSTITKSFERSLSDAIGARLKKVGSGDKVFGVSRLESHASLLLQIVDILLGCVMYDYKQNIGLISDKLSAKQDVVVSRVRDYLGTKSLANSHTYHKPNYFSIWEFSPKT